VQPYRQCLPPKVLAIPETFIIINNIHQANARRGKIVGKESERKGKERKKEKQRKTVPDVFGAAESVPAARFALADVENNSMS
jgi:hypothetical protein